MATAISGLTMIPTGNPGAASKLITEPRSSLQVAPSAHFAGHSKAQRAISNKRPLQIRAALPREEKPVSSAGSQVSWLAKAGQNCARTAAAAGLALLLNLSPVAPPSLAQEVLVRLPSAGQPVDGSFEVRVTIRGLLSLVQRTVTRCADGKEGLTVTQLFVDPIRTFCHSNHHAAMADAICGNGKLQ